MRAFANRCICVITLTCLLGLAPSDLFGGELELPAIFSEHMVLQQDAPVPVWGWAPPGSEVSVTIAGQTKSAKADANGKWTVKLDPLKAGEPTTLTVKGKETITIDDVLIGEVWLCSGQSNMAWTVNRAGDFEKEQAAAKFPKIRMFKESSRTALEPQDRPSGTWTVCSPETVGGFTATGSSVGGTPIEAWTSMEVMKGKSEFKPLFDRWAQAKAAYDPAKVQAQYEKQLAAFKAAQKDPKQKGRRRRAPRKPQDPKLSSHHPASLFNAKIAPLIPYAD
jgi:sialate O-acetylesterase